MLRVPLLPLGLSILTVKTFLRRMPGFVRAGLPEALQCYGDNPVVGQEVSHPNPNPQREPVG
jgi:hypothetical protein